MCQFDVLPAPARLIAETRLAFRREALEHVERAAAHQVATVSIDLGETREIDASGLGILVQIQKRAREMGVATRLLNPSEPVRRLLSLTRLDSLFELEGAPPIAAED